MLSVFSPTRQRNNTKQVFGFDIETYDRNREFYCGSIYGDNIQRTFFDKEDMIDFLKKPMFKNSYVCATNLGFDFAGLFYDMPDELNFRMQFRASDLIFCKTYLNSGRFNPIPKSRSDKSLVLLDTMNYAKLSVSSIGKIIGIPKLEKPDCLGRIPENAQERRRLIEYNMRDSEISQKFIRFLFDNFEKLGATPKTTIAQSSMSLYKNKYLKKAYFRHSQDDLLSQFNAYYGGRVESFKRGKIKNYNYYDFNSLYPSVMRNDYPDPNTLRKNRQNSLFYIENYDGVAEVEIYCPDYVFPLLPFKIDHKLIFPTGNFRGWYSNVELRKAIELGYTIKSVYHNYYFKDNCTPFREFVTDMYEKRMEYKSKGSNMEIVVKLLMNSLYGKFGEKFENRDNVIPLPENIEQLDKYDEVERLGNYVRVVNRLTDPRSHCIPIWAIYTTAYGRLKLYDILRNCDPVYCDTDSVITRKEYADKSGLGELKLEHFIKEGVIIKPKLYGFIDENNNPKVAGKGLPRMDYMEFLRFIENPRCYYERFLKMREALRRKLIPNEIIDTSKECSLSDDKRLWLDSFDPDKLEDSTPFHIADYRKIYKYTSTSNTHDIIKVSYMQT